MSTLIEISNAIIELFIVLFFFKRTLTSRQMNVFAYWGIFSGILLVHIVRSFFPISLYFNIGISTLICGSIAAILFKDLKLKKLIMLLIYMFILLMADIFARFIISAMMNITYSTDAVLNVQRYIGMIITNCLSFTISSYVSMLSKRKNSNITTKYWIMMLLFPAFSLFIIISIDIFILLSGVSDIKYILFLLVAIIGLVYFNVVVFEFIDTYSAKLRLAAAEELIEKQADNYHLLEINEKELRSLRHNIKKHIAIMENMLDNNDNSITEPQQIMNSLKELSSLPASITYTNDAALDSILNVECKKATEKKIDFLIKTNRILFPLNIEPIDKSTILCNAIDNAIEACEKVDKKFIVIDIASDEHKITICIENSSLPLSINNNFMPTSKKDTLNHGFGITSIKHSLKKYNGKLNFSYNDGIVKCIIMLDNCME